MIKAWFYREFRDHVAKKGYKLLRDDYMFIESTITNMPENRQHSIMRRYCEEWDAGLRVQDKTPPNQNLGRLRANRFLLEGVFINN